MRCVFCLCENWFLLLVVINETVESQAIDRKRIAVGLYLKSEIGSQCDNLVSYKVQNFGRL